MTIRGDRDLLSMALAQYLDNAAKYSFAGTAVKVAAWESHSEVMISVHNFGPPIPISDRERIFERFYRSEGTMHRAPGTGIGLSTVYRRIGLKRKIIMFTESLGTVILLDKLM